MASRFASSGLDDMPCIHPGNVRFSLTENERPSDLLPNIEVHIMFLIP